MCVLKKCPICGKEFEIIDKKSSTRKFCYECSPFGKNNNYVLLFQNMKKQIIKERGGKCERCGYDKYIGALQFHHRNQKEKEFTLGTKSGSCNWEKFKKEAEKCDLLCANCHAEVHHEIFLEENKNKESDNKKNKCKKCGKGISYGAEYCSECYLDMVRKNKNKEEEKENLFLKDMDCFEKKRPEREELKYLIRNFSFLEIGRKFGVSDNAIRKWCKKENLPHKASEIKKYSDEEWENI